MTWSEWIRSVTDGASARQIAASIHRSHTSVASWVRTGDPPAEVVIQIARAYRADPVGGLIASGALTMDDLMPYLRTALSHAPQTWLTDELHRRSRVWEEVTSAGETFTPWFKFPSEVEWVGPTTEEIRRQGLGLEHR